MTEFENKLVEKIIEKIDMDKLTEKIAEKAAELIVQKEYPSPVFTPPVIPEIIRDGPYKPIPPITVAYGVQPTVYTDDIHLTSGNSASYERKDYDR